MLELAECMSGSGCMSGIGMLDSRSGIGIAEVGRPRVNSLTRQSARSKASRACVSSSSSISAATRSITLSLPPSTSWSLRARSASMSFTLSSAVECASAICAAVILSGICAAALSGREVCRNESLTSRAGRLGADLTRGPLSRTLSLSKKKVRAAAIRREILLRPLPMPREPPLLEGARGSVSGAKVRQGGGVRYGGGGDALDGHRLGYGRRSPDQSDLRGLDVGGENAEGRQVARTEGRDGADVESLARAVGVDHDHRDAASGQRPHGGHLPGRRAVVGQVEGAEVEEVRSAAADARVLEERRALGDGLVEDVRPHAVGRRHVVVAARLKSELQDRSLVAHARVAGGDECQDGVGGRDGMGHELRGRSGRARNSRGIRLQPVGVRRQCQSNCATAFDVAGTNAQQGRRRCGLRLPG
eukprot:scaffold2156_cov67-Phaeocystis_antarctica.AAC.3